MTRRPPLSVLMISTDAVDVADLGLALRHARLEELFDARQAGGDVEAGDAAGVERPHGQLRARLADRLGGDDADRFTDADQVAGREVAAVARTADAVARLAGQRRANEDLLDAGGCDAVGDLLGDLHVALDDRLGALLASLGIDHRPGGIAAQDPALEAIRLGRVLLGLVTRDPGALLGAAIVLAGDHVLGNVDQAPRQVARVRRSKGGVGESLARAVGRDEVFEDRHALAEVAPHGHVDDATGGICHQATHAAQLADVALVTAGTRGGHHRHRASRIERLHHLVADLLGGVLPDRHDALVALILGDQAALELTVDRLDLIVSALEQPGLRGRDGDVVDGDGHAAARRVVEADRLDAVDQVGRLVRAKQPVAVRDELAQRVAVHLLIQEAQPLRQDLVEDHPTDRCAHRLNDRSRPSPRPSAGR